MISANSAQQLLIILLVGVVLLSMLHQKIFANHPQEQFQAGKFIYFVVFFFLLICFF